ncbi:hypothetical protein RN001_001227 [Aquatica leii]|uniref:THAP-type domain-containing protein n=1 Tax=Aquatica leii TaxID=1421715 RepID=A0AAN7SCM1_9COLE|nr:hypothetical protein RN001_001227 [Aquatica leii]
MSGLRYRKYCCVKNCKNNSKNNPSIRFFRMPADAIRCQNWLKNSGRADLTKKDVSESMQQTNQSVDTSRFTIESETGGSIIEVQPSWSYYSSDLATTPVKSSKDVFSQTSLASTANTR